MARMIPLMSKLPPARVGIAIILRRSEYGTVRAALNKSVVVLRRAQHERISTIKTVRSELVEDRSHTCSELP
jgi:hypothetical protein